MHNSTCIFQDQYDRGKRSLGLDVLSVLGSGRKSVVMLNLRSPAASFHYPFAIFSDTDTNHLRHGLTGVSGYKLTALSLRLVYVSCTPLDIVAKAKKAPNHPISGQDSLSDNVYGLLLSYLILNNSAPLSTISTLCLRKDASRTSQLRYSISQSERTDGILYWSGR